jgi:hypothetical protein
VQEREATVQRDRFVESIGNTIFSRKGNRSTQDIKLEDQYNMLEAIRQGRVDMMDVGQAAGRPGFTYGKNGNMRDPAYGLPVQFQEVINRAWDNASQMNPSIRSRDWFRAQTEASNTSLSTGDPSENSLTSKLGMKTSDYMQVVPIHPSDDRFTQTRVEQVAASQANYALNAAILGSDTVDRNQRNPYDQLPGTRRKRPGEDELMSDIFKRMNAGTGVTTGAPTPATASTSTPTSTPAPTSAPTPEPRVPKWTSQYKEYKYNGAQAHVNAGKVDEGYLEWMARAASDALGSVVSAGSAVKKGAKDLGHSFANKAPRTELEKLHYLLEHDYDRFSHRYAFYLKEFAAENAKMLPSADPNAKAPPPKTPQEFVAMIEGNAKKTPEGSNFYTSYDIGEATRKWDKPPRGYMYVGHDNYKQMPASPVFEKWIIETQVPLFNKLNKVAQDEVTKANYRNVYKNQKDKWSGLDD